jgi:hypothetical protein
VELQLRERGQLRSGTLAMHAVSASELRLGCNLFQHHHHEASPAAYQTSPIPPVTHPLHNGARPSAAADMADAVAHPQWPRSACVEPAVVAAPLATIPHITHPVRRIRDTLHTISVVSIPGRYLGGDTEGCAEEEDVISQEATTVHGWQRTQGHNSAQHMLGVWEG